MISRQPPGAGQRVVRRPLPKRKSGNPLVWTIPAVGVILVVLIGLGILRATGRLGSGSEPSGIGDPVPAAVLQGLRQVPDTVWDAAGAASAQPPVLVVPANAQPDPSAPTVLYVGAEYCPFCASQRWALVAALERFGDFTDLKLSASSPTDVYANTPTVSFHGASYRSDYVQFQAVELSGREAGPNGRYPTLQTLTSGQEALVRKYNAPPFVATGSAGAIPFTLVGGRHMWVGSQFQPSLLQGRTWSEIADALPAGNGSVARAVLANANVISATICAANGGRPSTICDSAGVRAAAAVLPTKGPTG